MAQRCTVRDPLGRICGRPARGVDPVDGRHLCSRHYDELILSDDFRRWPRITFRGSDECLRRD